MCQEVSRFKCQRISSGLVFQFEVWVSNDFKVSLTEDFFSGQIFQVVRSLEVSFFRSSLCQRGKIDSLWLILV